MKYFIFAIIFSVLGVAQANGIEALGAVKIYNCEVDKGQYNVVLEVVRVSDAKAIRTILIYENVQRSLSSSESARDRCLSITHELNRPQK